METPTREDFRFVEPLRVRWADIDAQGIVFNPNYLVYADVGMTEYMRAIGYPYPECITPFGADLFTVKSEANYRSSALFDDLLDIAVRVSRIGTSSITYAFGIFRGEELLCDVAITYVAAALDTKKPTPLPQPFIDKILEFEKTPPVRKAPA